MSIACQNAPDYTKLGLKFQNCNVICCSQGNISRFTGADSAVFIIPAGKLQYRPAFHVSGASSIINQHFFHAGKSAGIPANIPGTVHRPIYRLVGPLLYRTTIKPTNKTTIQHSHCLQLLKMAASHSSHMARQ